MVGLSIREISKEFTQGKSAKAVLSGLSLAVSPGEVIAIRGDNGTGKTTLLNIIAGIDEATSGELDYLGVDGRKPRIGFSQQDYSASLLPWLTVLDNVALPLRLRGIQRKQRDERAHHLLHELQFSLLPSGSFPHQLSGGQKQRVAIARALVHDPELLILDEPFANLDAHTTMDLQATLARVQEAKQLTVICVSHELDHCVFLADRVMLLDGSPAKIVKEFTIPLARPRKRSIMLSSEFQEVRSKILKAEESLYAASH